MQVEAVGGWAATEDARVAEVAHDLRLPLALILDQCERLRSHLPDGAESDELERIRDAARSMSRRVDGLLSLRFDVVPLDAGGLVEELVTRFRPLAHARGTDIVLQHLGSTIVDVDARAAEGALQNIIDNALRHARQTPVRVTVRTTMRFVVVEVADDGPGIPTAVRSEITARGRCLEGHGRVPGAAGLGLALAAAVAAQAGGSLRIGDAPEGGALVSVMLPVSRQRRRATARRSRLLRRT